MATLKEIAEAVGTSITTVSRVLNYDHTLSVSDEMRLKIIEVAQEMNYQTPRNRKTIPDVNQKRIGIIHWYDVKSEFDDPYYVGIRRGIENLANNSQVDTKILYQEEGEYQLKKLGPIDGLICVGKFTPEQVALFLQITNRIVFVDSSPDIRSYDSVVIDFKDAIKQVVDYFSLKGYTEVGYLGGKERVSEDILLGERRARYFEDYTKRLNMHHPNHIHIKEFNSESGYAMMKEVLKNKNYAKAYFCANDSIALGALKAIHEEGIKVPSDIALIGFNDDATSAFTYPSLTTIRVYTEFMGEQALMSLCEQFNGRTIPVRKMIPTELVLRESA
ncbi:MAG: LacI family DNA-binding transcriptional regulator [Candidatus Izemoplasmataceae bacterium]